MSRSTHITKTGQMEVVWTEIKLPRGKDTLSSKLQGRV